jgi:2-keto-4-pentenoate hydratase/2-oxohepta-3-ene-1,7-dioic acid hydratase in catechol pathway
MKLSQFHHEGGARLGIVEGDKLLPIDFSGDMISLIEKGIPIETKGNPLSISDVTLAPPVSRPSKIIALGLNYKDHADESKGKVPEVPLIFAKFPSSITGPNTDICWDSAVTSKVDFEAELAVIISKKATNCTEKEAMETVFGCTCANDVSARDLQFGDGQWVRGKSLDTFCPLGPWIVTADEIEDMHNLKIKCVLNGQIMQESDTGQMIFNIPTIISFISKHFTLFPGDVILTGTPHGVGAFREPPIYMKNGDEVVVEIEGIGRLKNICHQK